jgi:NADPH-dependent 2,4-dienoyl-CoA reductase/sulfur reductase-like enzyme
MSRTPRRILVVGGLAAGPSAASKAARVDPEAEVVLFEQGPHISYGICEIPYHIAGDVPGQDLVAYTPAQLKQAKRVEARVLHLVEEIHPRERSIRVRDTTNDKTYTERYDKLIIATGSRPRSLGLAGEDASNVFHVKTLEGGFKIKAFVDTARPSRAVIVGAGYIGIEMADALRTRGIEVTMLDQFDLPMSGLEIRTREEVLRVLMANGVRFVGGSPPVRFVIEQGSVRRVETANGIYDTDLVILAVGVEPETRLAQRAGIRTGALGGIITNPQQQTSALDIYAAGDCCEVKNLVSHKSMYLPLATIASKQGWVAGENAAGGHTRFVGAIGAIAVRAFKTEVAQVGLGSAEAARARFDVAMETITGSSRASIMPGSKKLTVTLIADRRSGRLLGAGLFGEEGAVLRANTLAVSIQHGLTVHEMQQWDLAYSPPFTPLWDPILIAANALEKKMFKR